MITELDRWQDTTYEAPYTFRLFKDDEKPGKVYLESQQTEFLKNNPDLWGSRVACHPAMVRRLRSLTESLKIAQAACETVADCEGKPDHIRLICLTAAKIAAATLGGGV